jgi:hypothetical protein
MTAIMAEAETAKGALFTKLGARFGARFSQGQALRDGVPIPSPGSSASRRTPSC